MDIKASEWIKDFLGEFVQIQNDAFAENLVGIYLHGSLAMESFNPVSSDVDLLVVVRDRLSRDEKIALGERLLGQAPELAERVVARWVGGAVRFAAA